MLPVLCWRGEKETSFFVKESALDHHVWVGVRRCIMFKVHRFKEQEIG